MHSFTGKLLRNTNCNCKHFFPVYLCLWQCADAGPQKLYDFGLHQSQLSGFGLPTHLSHQGIKLYVNVEVHSTAQVCVASSCHVLHLPSRDVTYLCFQFLPLTGDKEADKEWCKVVGASLGTQYVTIQHVALLNMLNVLYASRPAMGTHHKVVRPSSQQR